MGFPTAGVKIKLPGTEVSIPGRDLWVFRLSAMDFPTLF